MPVRTRVWIPSTHMKAGQGNTSLESQLWGCGHRFPRVHQHGLELSSRFNKRLCLKKMGCRANNRGRHPMSNSALHTHTPTQRHTCTQAQIHTKNNSSNKAHRWVGVYCPFWNDSVHRGVYHSLKLILPALHLTFDYLGVDYSIYSLYPPQIPNPPGSFLANQHIFRLCPLAAS